MMITSPVKDSMEGLGWQEFNEGSRVGEKKESSASQFSSLL